MLLRQTRAGAVAKLWEDFISKYPDAQALSRARKSDLEQLLGILGFGRMRTAALIDAAQWLVKYRRGEVPHNLEDLLRIPHIGSYSAKAVLCFAFGQKVEIVDTNVQRFFARYYDLKVKADIRRNPQIVEIAREALPREKEKARPHNYGLLDFTAEVCQSTRPRCEICPLSSNCEWGKIQLGGSRK